MTGVVLCGGQSTRMGTDKGMLQKNAATWAQLAFNKLSALSIPVVLSVNRQQQTLYSNLFDSSSLIIDDTNLAIGGPLHGILSVHKAIPSTDLFVVACDMISMQTFVLEDIYKNAVADNNNEYAAFVFKNEQKIEPLCGIYTLCGLQRIYIMCQHQQFKKHSMTHVLESLHTKYLSLPDNWRKYFSNYNSPEDLIS
jgi:molybdopterin-guanine dinucleotide biosynthesis protein A